MVYMEISYTTIEADHMAKAVEILRNRLGFSGQLCKRVRLYGSLLCDGIPHRMIDPVPAGSSLLISYLAEDELDPKTVLTDTNDIHIVYQDEWLLVADKPAYLLTHPSFLGETRALTTLLTDKTLHPVSRLDRNTSGLIVLAKNAFGHDQLVKEQMHKLYIGFVHGRMPESQGVIDAPIARSPGSIITREVHPGGQASKTYYRVLAELRYENGSLYQVVSFRLETGRTHQIRVHAKYLGHPLIGDSLYLEDELDASDLALGRQALHAATLGFVHPLTKNAVSLHAKLRPDLQLFLTRSTLLSGSLDGI